MVFVAFLVWSLEAEGFVIPTGSMATTLLGRHKEITCPQCGIVYTVNADREVESSGNGTEHRRPRRARNLCELPVRDRGGRRTQLLGRPCLRDEAGGFRSLPGWCRAVAVKRWDVTVFKLPEEPEVRYIKRVGRHAERGGSDRGRRPLGAANRLRSTSPRGCGDRSITSRPCR